MKRWSYLVVIAWALPASLHAQTAAGGVVGFLRSDGVVLPEMAFMDGAWREAWQPEFAERLANVTSYTWYDSTGVAHRVSAAGISPDCCFGRLGHQTDFPEPFTTQSFFNPTPILGYATSNPVGQAAFHASPRRPDMTILAAMLDSVAVIPDSITVEVLVDTWEADLDDVNYTFFQAQRVPRGRYFQPACTLVAGWLGTSPQDIHRMARGPNDCDGKGEATWRPWAVLERAGTTYLLAEVLGYTGGTTVIWRRVGPFSWQFDTGVTRENCC